MTDKVRPGLDLPMPTRGTVCQLTLSSSHSQIPLSEAPYDRPS